MAIKVECEHKFVHIVKKERCNYLECKEIHSWLAHKCIRCGAEDLGVKISDNILKEKKR